MGWAADEFKEVNLGDKRLNSRLIKLCDSFSKAPENPINQVCADWAETKAAYRFFQNEYVDVEHIMSAHRAKTSGRAANHRTVLAIQDTSYLVYTNHPKTKGLGKISLKKGKNEATTKLSVEAQVVTLSKLIFNKICWATFKLLVMTRRRW